MKKIAILLFSILLIAGIPSLSFAEHSPDHESETEHVESHGDTNTGHDGHDAAHDADHGHGAHNGPAGWSVIPFVLLLLMIATGPLFFEHFWHKFYPVIAILLALLVIGYYIIGLGDTGGPIHALAEYVQFIALLGSLFVASGGILINVDKEGTPLVNVMLLVIGAVVSNLIGTTGASMLLVRPFIRLNKDRIKAYHIMFFIFMVSNVGGSLTPIGDPPLFLGFLKGVPFEWTITHNLVPWIFAITILAIIFFIVDKKNLKGVEVKPGDYSGKVMIKGSKNFIWLAVIIAAVFIDPNVFPEYVPGIKMVIHGHDTVFSYIREFIMISVACLSYFFADKEALRGNEFEFEPIKEVAFIFIGIFGTMMPALQLVGDFAGSDAGRALISHNTLYWCTGVLSGVLDNAPTYMNFLTAALSANGGSIQVLQDVKDFAAASGNFASSPLGSSTSLQLTAISVASVFFGAMTYIGNGPNFMVKAIAEQVGVKMPSFFGYITRFSIPILLPILIVVWVIFFYFEIAQVIIDIFH